MIRNFFIAALFVSLFSSCTNGPGQGGKASIQGKVHVTNWNSTCTIVNGEYYAQDEDVFIIYGDDPSYGDKVSTGPDGTFWFKYLRPGTYKIYVYSEDCSSPSGLVSVEATVEITEKNQEVVLADLEIKN